jgi:hypothetical protein
VVEDAQRDVGTEFEGLLKASLQRLTPSREGHKRAAGQV